MKNPLFVLLLLFLFRRQGQIPFTGLSTLQMESLLDQVHSAIHAVEKVHGLTQGDLSTSLPDMKKMLEVVEKIPL